MKTGTYTYKFQTYVNGVRTYPTYTMRVRVVNEKANKYQVMYNGFHASGAAVNSLHWVRKDTVRLDDTSNPLPTPQPLSDNIRLPYKDND